MSITVALAGNPNSGKTTLFNALTGSNQSVGNWPGVTVEKKEGKLIGHKDVTITDLPGIYSLSPHTLEEMVARNYLINERPDAILNIIDGTNIERNLFLTTSLTELGIPVVVAVNMMDIVERSGDIINIGALSKALGCKVCDISALKGTNVIGAATEVIKAASGTRTVPQHSFSGGVEHTLAHIEEYALHNMPQEQQRFYAIKLFERDEKITAKLGLTKEQTAHIEEDIKRREQELDDDSESIITSERYTYIDSIIKDCVKIKNKGKLSQSAKIDKIVTNRFLALPIFAISMFIVYFVSVTVTGMFATAWITDGLFGEGRSFAGVRVAGLPIIIEGFLTSVNCRAALRGLILNGLLPGVGGVLGFAPQLFVLFFFLAFLERCGYIARITFILDRVFRRFGMSGKSFIPILIGTGCGVPGIMAARGVTNERERRMTIITTTFIPCGAKLPIIVLFAAALYGGGAWVAVTCYFIGLTAIICSGVILKKTKLFKGDASPFVMELPAYHMPALSGVLFSMWERGWSFIKKAGTVILLASAVIWFLSFFGWINGTFQMLDEKDMNSSILAACADVFAFFFKPLGWGNWKAVAAAFTGLVAKENIVGTLGILFGGGNDLRMRLANPEAGGFSAAAGFSFLAFNLLCAPCVAAMSAINREMKSRKWFLIAIGYQSGLAYIVSLCIYQFGRLFTEKIFGIGTVVAFAVLGGFLYMLFVPAKKARTQ